MAKKKTQSKNNKATRTVSKTHAVPWVVTLVMSIIFGWFGVDRFIMGKVWTGLLKLITIGGVGVWWITDIVLIATKYDFKNVEWR